MTIQSSSQPAGRKGPPHRRGQMGVALPSDFLAASERCGVLPDDRRTCPQCRRGAEQIQPLCLSGEPNWAKSRGMFMLNWVADEFQPEMLDKVFRPRDRQPASPWITSRAPFCERWFNWEFHGRLTPMLQAAAYQSCRSCGERTYERDSRNYTPMPLSAPGPLFRSNQWFNPFHSIVYMSQELCRAIGKSGFRSACPIPCSSDGIISGVRYRPGTSQRTIPGGRHRE